MTIEQMQRARNGRARYAASVATGSLPTSASTLPRSQSRPGDDRSLTYGKLSAHPSSQSVYDNVSTSLRKSTPIPNAVKQTRSDVNLTTIGQSETGTFSRTELARAKFQAASRSEDAKSVDYGMGMSAMLRKGSSQEIRDGLKSKSSDNVSGKTTPTSRAANSGSLDSNAAKRMLNTSSSLQNSPEDKLKDIPPQPPPKPDTRKPEPPPKTGLRASGKSSKSGGSSSGTASKPSSKDTTKSGASSSKGSSSKQGKSGSSKKKGSSKKTGLDIPDRERSPPSDNLLYDNLCYATTPSSSNENSDVPFLSSDEDEIEIEPKPKEKKRMEGRATGNTFKRSGGVNTPSANSPTSKLLMEYEMHLRNALARGLDAESYSLHTFEALLTQSMENVVALMREVHVELEEVRKEEQALQSHDEPEGSRAFANARSTTSAPKSSTLPLPGSTR
ncbi:Protein still life, isoform SIF type 1, partial [Stegodyphus mimosarum]